MATRTQLRRLSQIEAQLQQREADPTAIPELAASRDVKIVQDAVAAKYDMFVADAYAADLIAFVDATNARIAELEAQVHELSAELEQVIRDGLIRHMWQIQNPKGVEPTCPECGKPMALYLEEDRLTPAVWRCFCGHRQLEARLEAKPEDTEAMPR